RRLHRTDSDAEEVAEEERQPDERGGRRPRLGEHGVYRTPRGDAPAPLPARHPREPGRVLCRERPVQPERLTLRGQLLRRGRRVVFASGAELQSMNPLVTIHPLAKQVQRYVLLTTLARYDTALVPRPYLARMWVWSPDLQALRFRLHSGVRWHDGTPTTAR